MRRPGRGTGGKAATPGPASRAPASAEGLASGPSTGVREHRRVLLGSEQHVGGCVSTSGFTPAGRRPVGRELLGHHSHQPHVSPLRARGTNIVTPGRHPGRKLSLTGAHQEAIRGRARRGQTQGHLLCGTYMTLNIHRTDGGGGIGPRGPPSVASQRGKEPGTAAPYSMCVCARTRSQGPNERSGGSHRPGVAADTAHLFGTLFSQTVPSAGSSVSMLSL